MITASVKVGKPFENGPNLTEPPTGAHDPKPIPVPVTCNTVHDKPQAGIADPRSDRHAWLR